MRKLLLVVAVLVLAASAQANLLQNGAFELGNANEVPPFWTNVGLGPTYIPIVKGVSIPPSDNFHAEHISWGGTPDAGYLHQQVNVDAGSMLTANVDFAWWSGGGEPDNWHIFGVGIDPTGGTDWSAGSVVKTIAPTVARENWSNVAVVDVDATGGGTVTVFLYSECIDDNGGWWAHALDDAELTAEIIPEPCSLFALGAGLVGLVGVLRRQR